MQELHSFTAQAKLGCLKDKYIFNCYILFYTVRVFLFHLATTDFTALIQKHITDYNLHAE